jgi:hypothetical protein
MSFFWMLFGILLKAILLNAIRPKAILLNVIFLNGFLQHVILLNAVLLNVMAPFQAKFISVFLQFFKPILTIFSASDRGRSHPSPTAGLPRSAEQNKGEVRKGLRGLRASVGLVPGIIPIKLYFFVMTN